MFIGRYNKAAAITFIGVVFAIFGCYYAIIDQLDIAILCLVTAGICDMFDGKIARMSKNQTKEDVAYGIQLDSLADIFGFGVFPVIISITIGLTSWYHFIIYAMYIICGITRLSHFNIMAEKNGPVKVYTGLPITSAALIYPFFWLFTLIWDVSILNVIYPVIMLLMALLFISKVKVKKPNKAVQLTFCIAAIIFAISMFFIMR